MNLKIEYIPNTGVTWKGLTAVISYNGGTFTRLGLRKGQNELSQLEVNWLEMNEPAIMEGCTASAKCF